MALRMTPLPAGTAAPSARRQGLGHLCLGAGHASGCAHVRKRRCRRRGVARHGPAQRHVQRPARGRRGHGRRGAAQHGGRPVVAHCDVRPARAADRRRAGQSGPHAHRLRHAVAAEVRRRNSGRPCAARSRAHPLPVDQRRGCVLHSERERVQGRTAETERIRARIIQELRQTQSTRLLQKRRNFDSDAALQEIAMVDDDPSCACSGKRTGATCGVSHPAPLAVLGWSACGRSSVPAAGGRGLEGGAHPGAVALGQEPELAAAVVHRQGARRPPAGTARVPDGAPLPADLGGGQAAGLRLPVRAPAATASGWTQGRARANAGVRVAAAPPLIPAPACS